MICLIQIKVDKKTYFRSKIKNPVVVHQNLVLIPTYNEKENVERMIRKVFSLKTQFEILIIDDNSPDGTASIVERLMTEFPEKLHILKRAGKEGLGESLPCRVSLGAGSSVRLHF